MATVLSIVDKEVGDALSGGFSDVSGRPWFTGSAAGLSNARCALTSPLSTVSFFSANHPHRAVTSTELLEPSKFRKQWPRHPSAMAGH
jgi:hypothetical protein